MTKLSLDRLICSRCATCQTVCVVSIIGQDAEGFPLIQEEQAEFCLRCGHCAAFCPSGALTLDFSPQFPLRPDPTLRLDPAALAAQVKLRRSIRHFTNQLVARETILELLDVVRYAASSGNSQTTSWLILQEPEQVRQIAGLTIDWMRAIRATEHPLGPYVAGLIEAWDGGQDRICHGAPHLVLALHPASGPLAEPTDSIIAMTHLDLIAPAHGLGACWAGFVMMAAQTYAPLQAWLGLGAPNEAEARKVGAAMLLGYPQFRPRAIPARNPLAVRWK